MMMFDVYQRAYAYSGLEGVIKYDIDIDIAELTDPIRAFQGNSGAYRNKT